jgi:hypothetical protein
MTPTGSELSSDSLGKSTTFENLPPQSPPSGVITGQFVDADTSELLSMWSVLDELARRDLLTIARSWAERSQRTTQGPGRDPVAIETATGESS